MADPSLSDAELVARARKGDRGAFGQLAERHYRMVSMLARATIRNRAEAEDVVQESLQRAYRTLDSLPEPERFGGWIFHITMRTCLDHLRKKGCHDPVVSHEEPEGRCYDEETMSDGRDFSAWLQHVREINETLGKAHPSYAAWARARYARWLPRWAAARAGTGHLDQAIALYTEALAFDPREVSLYVARGAARLACSQIQGALDDFTRACEMEPRKFHHWRSLGHAQHRHGDAKAAVASFSRAIALAEGADLVACLLDRSLAHRASDPALAIQDASRAIDLEPRSSASWFNRAEAYAKKGELDAAIADFDRAIELGPGSPVAWGRRAAALLQRGEHERALADLSRAIELAPLAADFWLDRGHAKAQLLDCAGAEADFSRAIELRPSPRAFASRGLVRLAHGDRTEAVRDLNRFLELAPNDPSSPLVRERLDEARSSDPS